MCYRESIDREYQTIQNILLISLSLGNPFPVVLVISIISEELFIIRTVFTSLAIKLIFHKLKTNYNSYANMCLKDWLLDITTRFNGLLLFNSGLSRNLLGISTNYEIFCIWYVSNKDYSSSKVRIVIAMEIQLIYQLSWGLKVFTVGL